MQSKLEHPLRKLPRPLTVEALEPSKSKDVIDVHYEEDWTAMRSGRAGKPIYCYHVTNKTNEHEYDVELLEDDNGEPCAWDNCLSARDVACKHIRAALKDLLQRQPEFGQKIFN
jgi:hypothetical protein